MTMNWKQIIVYGLLGLISLIFVVAGGLKTFSAKEMVDNMSAIGYGSNWQRFIGITELIGVIGLWIPRFRALALVLLWPYAVGGLAVHISHGHSFWERSSLAALVSLLIPLALWVGGYFDRFGQKPVV
ncbi:MAG: DoxX family protein [Cytophagales bacterium]|nr:MAG: DoxX family protein [Cytophagales bacterium]